MRGNSWLAEELLDSQEGLCSMELVSWLRISSSCYQLESSYTVPYLKDRWYGNSLSSWQYLFAYLCARIRICSVLWTEQGSFHTCIWWRQQTQLSVHDFGQKSDVSCVTHLSVHGFGQKSDVSCVTQLSVHDFGQKSDVSCVTQLSVHDFGQKSDMSCVTQLSVHDFGQKSDVSRATQLSVHDFDQKSDVSCVTQFPVHDFGQKSDVSCVMTIS